MGGTGPVLRRRRLVGRRMSILDAMILAAAFAPGFVLAKSWLGAVSPMPLLVSPLSAGVGAASWVALWLTLAFIPIRLSRPRPSLRRIARQPGLQACAAVGVALLIYVLAAGYYLLPPWRVRNGLGFNFLGSVQPMHLAGPAVATAWIALALSGGWRSERSWIDRCGRSLGSIWIIAYFLDLLFL